MEAIKKNRIDAIDVAKGIGIILVVFAHINYSEPWYTIIYSFHMPLFFVLSGMVMNVNKYQTFKDFFKDKFSKMIVPYLVFCLLGILSVAGLKLLDCFLNHQAWEGAGEFFAKAGYSVFWAPYSGKYFIKFNTPMWFVPCLVLVQLMYYTICRLTNNKLYVCVISLLITVFGYITEANILPFDFSVLPFNFSSACFSVGFFALGNIISPQIIKIFAEKVNKHSIFKYLATIVVSASIMVFFGIMNGKVSIGSRVLGNGFLFYISGISGTLLILAISKILDFSKILKFFGRNSFIIMGCHMIIYRFLHTFFDILGKISKFSMPQEVWEGVSVAFTILLSAIFVVAYNAIKKRIKERRS